MYFADALTLDAPRRTNDGYMAVRARAARTGVYQYSGTEVDPQNAHGLRDQATVNVLRDEAAVFDERAVRSFIAKPITDDHPREAVTASNWRDHGRGIVMGAVRDGDHLAFDLVLMDAGTIAKVEAGKAELSNGYAATLEFGDFAGPAGEKCQARQAAIIGNHVAIVDRGRAGASCRIGDAALCAVAPPTILDSLTTQEKPVKTMLIDGLTVDISNADTAQATIATILAARDSANNKVAGLETRVSTLTAEKATLDAQVTTLEQAVKDAKPTPAQLREAGKQLVIVGDKARAIGVTINDEMDESQIMAATVTAKMGDAAKNWTADQIAASFAVLTKDAKLAASGIHPLGAPAMTVDAATEYATDRQKQRRALSDAWRTPFNPAEAAA